MTLSSAVLDVLREWGRLSGRRSNGDTRVEVPPFPLGLHHWYRMNVTDLKPHEYWATSKEDFDVATLVQNTVHEGRQIATAEMKREEKTLRDLERKEREAQERLAERVGRM